MAIHRKKLFQLYAIIAIFLLSVHLVPAVESENAALSDFELDETIVEVDNVPEVPSSVEATESATAPINDDANIVDTATVVDTETEAADAIANTLPEDFEASLESPTLAEVADDEEEDNIIIEAAVSSLGESVSSKLMTIASRIKALAISKQTAKKLAAAGLGAWGAATGVGWAMQNFGGGKKLFSK